MDSVGCIEGLYLFQQGEIIPSMPIMRGSGFGIKEANRADKAAKQVEKIANSMYDIGSVKQNVDAYMRDLPIRRQIQSEKTMKTIFLGRQRKHIPNTLEYNQYVKKLNNLGQFGPSRLTITQEEMQALINKYSSSGVLGRRKDGSWDNTEEITIHDEIVGVSVNNLTGAEADTTVFKIHYSNKGTHIVPGYPSRKGAKGNK